jgi:glycogen debranching enzyme
MQEGAADPQDDLGDDLLRAIRAKPAVRPIADAVVVKDDEVFFLCPPSGSVPLTEDHGYGLFYHDCRYLNGYQLRLSGLSPTALASSAAIGFEATLQLTNPEFEVPDGPVIPKETLGIHWTRLADGHELALHDGITLQNFGFDRADFSISLVFRAEFEDIFQVRGLLAERPGRLLGAAWRDDVLAFTYAGADGLWRALGVHLVPEPTVRRQFGGGYAISLGPGESCTIEVSLVLAEERTADEAAARVGVRPDADRVKQLQRRSARQWTAGQTQFRSDNPSLDNVVQRSLRDLRMLRSGMAGRAYFSAGLPWYGALFGRDSAITAMATLAFDSGIAAETLRLLAAYQGRVVDRFREEEPGKILHEVRVGELAHLEQVPHSRYFGTVDATPLFLVLVGRHAAWTGDLSLFRELRENVDLALRWMDTYANLSGNGWLEYQGRTPRGLTNEGWKDSGDCIINDDGSLATPPIALVEPQAYAWLAKVLLADLFRREHDADRADELLRQAADLRDRFERSFWMEDAGTYALALQEGTRQARAIASNAGHALWTGIASPERAQSTARRLMAADMFSGWGIRTLSSSAPRYNPIGYHLGTVWPHDNAMIGVGFRQYGLDDPAMRLLASMIEAAGHFPHQRLPELFAGFERGEYAAPVSYPVACHPQAWSAASVPYLMQSLLGLEPDAFDRRLRIARPVLPSFVHELELRDLAVADARVDLLFERRGLAPDVTVTVLEVHGELEVTVEP